MVADFSRLYGGLDTGDFRVTKKRKPRTHSKSVFEKLLPTIHHETTRKYRTNKILLYLYNIIVYQIGLPPLIRALEFYIFNGTDNNEKHTSLTYTHAVRAQNMRESFKNTHTHINTVYRNVPLFRFCFFVWGDVPFSGFTFDVTNFCNNLRLHTSPLPGNGGGSTLFPEY